MPQAETQMTVLAKVDGKEHWLSLPLTIKLCENYCDCEEFVEQTLTAGLNEILKELRKCMSKP